MQVLGDKCVMLGGEGKAREEGRTAGSNSAQLTVQLLLSFVPAVRHCHRSLIICLICLKKKGGGGIVLSWGNGKDLLLPFD